MAIAHVQSAIGDWSSGTSYNTTLTATTGNLLVVSVHFYASNSSTDVSSISDGVNTYTQIDTHTETLGGALIRLTTYYAKNITGGSLTLTTTLSASNVNASRTVIAEVSGADAGAPLDVHTVQSQTNPGSGTDAITSGSVSTSTSGQYVYGATIPSNNSTFSAGTGFTDVTHVALAAAEYQIQSAAGSIAATFTESGGTLTYFTAVATFKAAASSRFFLLGRH